MNLTELQDCDGPSFAHVDSASKVKELFELGILEPLYLMPLEFGGPDVANNRLYVPIGIADIKMSMDIGIIAPLIEKGTVSHYSATPEYIGDSFVPARIVIKATNPGHFESCIEIWGDAKNAYVESNSG